MANLTLKMGKQVLKGLRSERTMEALRLTGHGLAAFLLSAAALLGDFQPLALGFLCAGPSGLPAVCAALGGAAGYLAFWGIRGAQGVAWMIGGLAAALALGDRGITRRQMLLMPALAAVIVSGTGVLFLLRFGEQVGISVYLLRVAVGTLAALIFGCSRRERGTTMDWAVQALGVLALAQIMPVRYLGLGYIAAGFLGAASGFPEAVLAGLALDLARVTNVPMTGVLCLGFCLRMIPGQPKWFCLVCPALAYVPVSLMGSGWDVLPLPGLLVGGILAGFVPGYSGSVRAVHRRGETAVAQVRLEQMSMVLSQMEQAMLLTEEPALDQDALLLRSVDTACDTCPERRSCRARSPARQMDPRVLEQPGISGEDIPPGCRKPARLLGELRRGQEQLRRIKGDRHRMEVCRRAVGQQYGFLAEYLQNLSDDLTRRRNYRSPRFRPEVGVSSRSLQQDNGDQCVWFAGTQNRYFVVLCDGMGTGTAAMRESKEAVQFLQQLLSVGFPAEYALRSLNSMSVLRELGGCATVDLLQLHLDTGRGELYKWGAASSYLSLGGQLKKIGTAGAPPGLSEQARETMDRLSLGGGEVLILLSDGAGEEGLLQSNWTAPSLSPGEMAAAILERSADGGDDATAVVIRLVRSGSSTQ